MMRATALLLDALRVSRARLREFFNRSALRAEDDAEMEFHLEMQTLRFIENGMSEAEAHRAARIAFGGVQQFREDRRSARGLVVAEHLVRDVRFALRRLMRSPGYTAGIVVTLAVGMGAALALGTLVHGVLIAPLPYATPNRLVSIQVQTPGIDVSTTDHSGGTYALIAERARSFDIIGGAMINDGVSITDGDHPERISAALVTPSMLRLLGVFPAAGRAFTDDDASRELVPVMISHALWTRRFGNRPDIAGQKIELNRGTREIVGVLPQGLDFPSPNADVFYPERVDVSSAGLTSRYLTVVARLRADVSIAQAQAELNALAPQLSERFPTLSAESLRASGFQYRVMGLRAAMTEPVRTELLLIALLAVGLVGVAIANVTTLSLLRAERNRGEIAIARALGAHAAPIIRRFVAEAMVLAAVGAALAVPIALAAIAMRFGFPDGSIPRLHSVRAESGGIAIASTALMVTMVCIAFVCAARTLGASLGGNVSTRFTPGLGWRRTQHVLVCLQFSVSLALLLNAGLLARSVWQLVKTDVGFVAEGASKFAVRLPFRPYPTYQHTASFHTQVVDLLAREPGVRSVAASMQFPSTSQMLYVRPRVIAGEQSSSRRESLVNANVVTPGFFETLQIPVRSGRTFAAGDLATPNHAVVLSASLARALFGERNAVGEMVQLASTANYPPYRVVGVVGDVYSDRIADGPLRTLYFPLLDERAAPPADVARSTALDTVHIPFVPAGMHFTVRGALTTSDMATVAQRIVRSVDARVPVWDVQSLTGVIASTTARARLTLTLVAISAAATLLLAVVGLYSVVAFAVAGRAREFAVRMAVGGTPASVARTVLRSGAATIGTGVLFGVALALASSQVLRSMLYDVSRVDSRVYAGGILVTIALAVLAMYLPARRASRVDPASVLRGE